MGFCKRWMHVFLLFPMLLGCSVFVGAAGGLVSPERLCICPGGVATFACSVVESGGNFTWTTNTTSEACRVFSSSPQSQCGQFIAKLETSSVSTLTATSAVTSDPGNILIQCCHNVDPVGNGTLLIAGPDIPPPTLILHNVTSGDIQGNGDGDTRNVTLRWTLSELDDCSNTIHFNVTPDDPTHCRSCEVGPGDPGMQDEFSCQVMQGIGQSCIYRVYAVHCGDTQNGTMSEPVEVNLATVQIGFNPTTYTVSENMGWVTFFIEKQGASERDVTVSFSTVDGSATASTDYATTSQSVTFTPSDTLRNVTVPITDDSIYELQETFSAMLTTSDPGVEIFNDTASATIIDSDSEFSTSASPGTLPTTSPGALPTTGPGTLQTVTSPGALPTTSPGALPTTGPGTPQTATSPETLPTTSPGALPTTGPGTLPTTGPGTLPTTSPGTLPTTTGPGTPQTATSPETLPTTSPGTLPTTGPGTLPTTSPGTLPTTSPRTFPTTGPGTLPTTGPRTLPTTSPGTLPTTSPGTLPTTGPGTLPTTGPGTLPTTSGPETLQTTSGPGTLPTTSGPGTLPTTGPGTLPTTTGPETLPTTSPGALPTGMPILPTSPGGLDVSDSGCSLWECWYYILPIVIPVFLLIAIIIVVACIGFGRKKTKKKTVWTSHKTPQNPNGVLSEIALPDVGVELSNHVYYADPDEFRHKENIYSPDPKESETAAADDSNQMEDRPEDHIPTYADPRTIERGAAPETGDVYTLVDMSKKQVPVVMEEDPYELVEIEKTDQLADLQYAVLDLFQNEEEPQTVHVPPHEEPVVYSMINPSAQSQPPPEEEGNKNPTSTTTVV